jgi:Nuclease A inhibitor-like protein
MIDDVDVRLARSIATLLRGTGYSGSESDSPWRAFTLALPTATVLTPASLRAALRVKPSERLDITTFSHYFTELLDPASGDDLRPLYTVLRDIMRSTLKRRMLAHHRGRGDGVLVPTYLVGQSASGAVVGVKAISVET